MNKTYRVYKFIILMIFILIVNILMILLEENAMKIIMIILLPIIILGLILSLKCKIIINDNEIKIFIATYSTNKEYKKSSIRGLTVKYCDIKKIDTEFIKNNIFPIELLDGNIFFFHTNLFFKKDIKKIHYLISLKINKN